MKKRCAKEALKFIKDKSIIGLGGGSTISYLVSFIKEAGLDISVVTPSFNTEKLCIENGLKVLPTWTVDHVSLAFDGCDEVDNNLNALKSGGGIHTKEKIIASMADDYILLVDESKVSERLTFKHPVVLEVVPESIAIVKKKVQELGGEAHMRTSAAKDGFAVSDSGMFLMDVMFNEKDVKDIAGLSNKLKQITGVVDTSLFCNKATKAVVVSEEGIRVIEHEREEA